MKKFEIPRIRVGKIAVRLATICLLFAVLNPLHLKAQSGRRDDASYKDFIDGVGEMLYFLAWPSAVFDSVSFEGVSPAYGGADVKVKLHGKSSFSDEHLWTEVIVVIRDGEIRDIKWGRNNAILAQPGSTITALGEALAELNVEYERSQSDSGSSFSQNNRGSSYSAGPATTLKRLHIRSLCNEKTYVAVLYFDGGGNWVRKGWFNVDHDETINTGITTGNDNIYLYAESDRLEWNGEKRAGSVNRTVVSGKFQVVGENSPTGSNLRNVSFSHADMTGSGSQYTYSLSCDHRH